MPSSDHADGRSLRETVGDHPSPVEADVLYTRSHARPHKRPNLTGDFRDLRDASKGWLDENHPEI